MATRVRSRIQRMLRDLEVDDGDAMSSASVLAATTGPGASEAHSDEFKHLLMQPGTSTIAGSEVDYSDTTSDSDQHHLHAQRGNVPTPGRRGFSPTRDQYNYLEHRLLKLMTENKALQLTADQQASRRVAEVGELQAQLAGAVRELAQRQQEVEAAAPLMRLKAEDFKGKLRDLRISSAQVCRFVVQVWS